MPKRRSPKKESSAVEQRRHDLERVREWEGTLMDVWFRIDGGRWSQGRVISVDEANGLALIMFEDLLDQPGVMQHFEAEVSQLVQWQHERGEG